jgi:hypothetical protein
MTEVDVIVSRFALDNVSRYSRSVCEPARGITLSNTLLPPYLPLERKAEDNNPVVDLSWPNTFTRFSDILNRFP